VPEATSQVELCGIVGTPSSEASIESSDAKQERGVCLVPEHRYKEERKKKKKNMDTRSLKVPQFSGAPGACLNSLKSDAKIVSV
jgi:hypothetical protein